MASVEGKREGRVKRIGGEKRENTIEGQRKRDEGATGSGAQQGEASLFRDLAHFFRSTSEELRFSKNALLTGSRQAGRVLEVFAHSGAVVVAHAGRVGGGKEVRTVALRFFFRFFVKGVGPQGMKTK